MTTFNRRSSGRLGALVFSAASAAVHAQGACAPGTTFGITAYQCANCGAASYRDSTRTIYTFGAEPVVMETTPGNRIRPGDVVVAVNGNPITTRAGADQFAYPPIGETLLTVRRNGMNVEIAQMVSAPAVCTTRGFFAVPTMSGKLVLPDSMIRQGGAMAGAQGGVSAGGRGGGRGGRGGGGGGGGIAGRVTTSDSATGIRLCMNNPMNPARPVPTGRGDSITVRYTVDVCAADTARARLQAAQRNLDSARTISQTGRSGFTGTISAPESQSSFVDLKNFGILLSCRPTCTRSRARDGSIYWKFDGYPAIGPQGSVKEGVAVKAGLHEGDVIISINGVSPLSEEGGLLLNRTDRELTINLEISRAGKREKYTLKL